MNINIFKKMSLRASFSSGVINDKSVFVPPCILLGAIKRPKLRFKNQNLFWKEYLKKTGRKGLKDMPNSEYIKYITESEKNGETQEYIKWRKDNQKKILVIKKLIADFNRTKNKINITLLVFEDGIMRIESDSQSISVFKKREKMKLGDKKIIMKKMTEELKLFISFIEEKI